MFCSESYAVFIRYKAIKTALAAVVPVLAAVVPVLAAVVTVLAAVVTEPETNPLTKFVLFKVFCPFSYCFFWRLLMF